MSKKKNIKLEIIKKHNLNDEDLKLIQNILDGVKALEKLLKGTALQAFEIGGNLKALRERDPARTWKNLIEEVFPFTVKPQTII